MYPITKFISSQYDKNKLLLSIKVMHTWELSEIHRKLIGLDWSVNNKVSRYIIINKIKIKQKEEV